MREKRFMASVLAMALILSATLATHASAQTRTAKKPAPTSAVNLNVATAAELEVLPGVGPAMATRIVEYRQKNGAFKKVEDLMNVKGIGEKKFLKLKSLVTIAATPAAKTAER